MKSLVANTLAWLQTKDSGGFSLAITGGADPEFTKGTTVYKTQDIAPNKFQLSFGTTFSGNDDSKSVFINFKTAEDREDFINTFLKNNKDDDQKKDN